VSFGSRLIGAPHGTLTRHRWLWFAKRRMWEFKYQTPWMEFGVIDRRTDQIAAATCEPTLVRSHP
jgi:hypothetical protein